MDEKERQFHLKVNRAYREVYGTSDEAFENIPSDVEAILRINAFALTALAMGKLGSYEEEDEE